MRYLAPLALVPLAACSLVFEVSSDAGSTEPYDAADVIDVDAGILGPIQTLSDVSKRSVASTLVWDGRDVYAAWQALDPKVLAPSEVHLKEIGSDDLELIITDAANPAMVTAPNDSLVIAWEEGGASEGVIRGVGFSTATGSSGEVQTLSAESSRGKRANPKLARSGSGIAAAWVATSAGESFVIEFARLDGAGELITGTTAVIDNAAAPELGFFGESYGVAWHSPILGAPATDVFLRLIQEDGTLGASARITETPLASRFPVVDADGTGFVVVWQEGDGLAGTDSTLEYRKVNIAGAVGTRHVLVEGPAEPSHPALAAHESGFAVAWEDTRFDKTVIFFQEFAPDGTSTTSEVQLSDEAEDASDVSLVRVGDGYAASWTAGPAGATTIQFRTITP